MRKAWQNIPKKIDPEKEKQLKEEPLEKGDFAAMLLASLISIFLPVALVLLLLSGVMFLLFAWV